MGYFDEHQKQFNDAQAPLSKRFNLEGNYVVAILTTKMKKPRKIGGSDNFICEMVTLQSTNPAQEVGAKTSQVIKMEWDGSLGDIKSLIAAVAKRRFEEVTIPIANAVVDVERDANGNAKKDAFGQDVPKNPLKGEIARLRCYTKQTQSEGTFTVHEWSACSAEEEAKLKPLAAKYVEQYSAAKTED